MLAESILFFRTTDKKKGVALLKFLTKVDMKHEAEFMNTDFVVLKAVKKPEKYLSFFFKKRKIFSLRKILPMQTIN